MFSWYAETIIGKVVDINVTNDFLLIVRRFNVMARLSDPEIFDKPEVQFMISMVSDIVWDVCGERDISVQLVNVGRGKVVCLEVLPKPTVIERLDIHLRTRQMLNMPNTLPAGTLPN